VQNTAFSTNKTLNIRGEFVDLSEPRIMGILNVTPDSFYDGGRYTSDQASLTQAEKMCRDGATFIDVGGYSSRPGAEDVPEREELARVIAVVESIARNFPSVYISVDTFRSTVARAAVEHGAGLINDISGGTLDAKMFETAAALSVPYVLMHMKGTPKTMSSQASYEDVAKELLQYFAERVHQLTEKGIHDVIIDPGFGFAKTPAHNFELLSNLTLLRMAGRPIMVGISRKSLIWKTLKIEPEDALNGTTALNTVALLNGADILRVHDVKEAREVIQLVKAVKAAGRA